jgi:hypothetical protein
MEVQAMFVALSRRGQTLVQRQIHLIDEFGRNEINPDALAKLFALDHLAARMRRNEENLLVLAGGEPGRWITRPVALVDLMRAAAQEIEAYLRVDIVESAAVAVAAPVAGDAIHLLAELLENATSFSPPHTRVRVAARRTFDGLSITITDSGIGMPAARVAEVNERLAHPSALTSNLIGTMGLLVVARLAHRQGIGVRLDATPASGTTATVLIPDHTMPLTTGRLQPGRGSGMPPRSAATIAVAGRVPRWPEPPAGGAQYRISARNRRPSPHPTTPTHCPRRRRILTPSVPGCRASAEASRPRNVATPGRRRPTGPDKARNCDVQQRRSRQLRRPRLAAHFLRRPRATDRLRAGGVGGRPRDRGLSRSAPTRPTSCPLHQRPGRLTIGAAKVLATGQIRHRGGHDGVLLIVVADRAYLGRGPGADLGQVGYETAGRQVATALEPAARTA